MTSRARTIWAAFFTASAILTTLDYVTRVGLMTALEAGWGPWVSYLTGGVL